MQLAHRSAVGVAVPPPKGVCAMEGLGLAVPGVLGPPLSEVHLCFLGYPGYSVGAAANEKALPFLPSLTPRLQSLSATGDGAADSQTPKLLSEPFGANLPPVLVPPMQRPRVAPEGGQGPNAAQALTAAGLFQQQKPRRSQQLPGSASQNLVADAEVPPGCPVGITASSPQILGC